MKKTIQLFAAFISLYLLATASVLSQTNWNRRLLILNAADSIMDAYTDLCDLSDDGNTFSEMKANGFVKLFKPNAKVFNEVCLEVLKKNGQADTPFKIGYSSSPQAYVNEVRELHTFGLPDYRLTFYNLEVKDIDRDRIQAKIIRAGVLSANKAKDGELRIELNDTLRVYMSFNANGHLRIDSIVPVGLKIAARKDFEIEVEIEVEGKVSVKRKISDYDGDGIEDHKDVCRYQWSTDVAGCPDLDLDKDGVLNFEDCCPRLYGNKDSYGCPDTDGDQVPDTIDTRSYPFLFGKVPILPNPRPGGNGIALEPDECPSVKGSIYADGCPDLDGDGFHDKIDDCPCEEGYDESEGRVGCPLDSDNDGIRDDMDAYDTMGFYDLGGKPLPKFGLSLLATYAVNASYNLSGIGTDQWDYENVVGTPQLPLLNKQSQAAVGIYFNYRFLSGTNSGNEKKFIAEIGGGLSGAVNQVDFSLTGNAWDYKATDGAGNVFRQILSVSNLTEQLSSTSIHPELSFKIGVNPYKYVLRTVRKSCQDTVIEKRYQNVQLKKLRIAPFIQVGMGVSVVLRSVVSGNSMVDMEAVYFTAGEGYRFAEELNQGRGYRYITQSPSQNQQYFDRMQSAGFNVGLNMDKSADDKLSPGLGYFGTLSVGFQSMLSLKSAFTVAGVASYSIDSWNSPDAFKPFDQASSQTYQSFASGITGLSSLTYGLRIGLTQYF